MAKIQVDPVYCKACELCINACKLNQLALGKEANAKGYHTVVQAKDGCIGCKMCAVMCPEGAITVYK